MPRRSAAQNKAISDKISKLKGEGYPTKQATAIAMRMYREGEIKPKKATKKKASPRKKSAAGRKKRTSRTSTNRYRK
jgi:hypothetical protein